MDARIHEALTALGQVVAFRSAPYRSLNAATKLARTQNSATAVEHSTKFQQRTLCLRRLLVRENRRGRGRVRIERLPHRVCIVGKVPLRNPRATDDDSDGDGSPRESGPCGGGPGGTGGGSGGSGGPGAAGDGGGGLKA